MTDVGYSLEEIRAERERRERLRREQLGAGRQQFTAEELRAEQARRQELRGAAPPTIGDVRLEDDARREEERQRGLGDNELLRNAAFANGGQITIEDIRRERARRAAARSGGDRVRPGGISSPITGERTPTAVDELSGGLAALNQGLFAGWGDEVSGGIRAAWEGAGDVVRQGIDLALGDNPGAEYGWGPIARAAERGYRTQTEYDRGALSNFRQRRPNVAAFTEGTGTAAPVAAALLLGQPEAAAYAYARPTVTRGALSTAARGSGPRAFAAQTAQGAATGSTLGATYGAGASDDGWENRLEGARDGALVGGFTGAVAPTVVNAGRGALSLARPAWDRFVGAAERIPVPAPNTLGMNGGNMAAGGGRRRGALRPPPPPPEIPDAAVNRVERAMQRSRMSVDDLDQAFTGARADPQGQVVADVFGDNGVRMLRPMVQAPGETGNRAAEVARQRFADAPARITDTLRRSLNVSESRAAAIGRLEQDYRRESGQAYADLWQHEPTPQELALFEERLAPLLSPDNPNNTVRSIMQDAIRRAERQFELDLNEGIVQGEVTDNLPRYLHYIRGALGDVASFEASPLRGTSGRELASIRQLYRRFGDAMDPPRGQGEAIVPGYRQTTERAGDYFTAREALDEGANWLNMSAEEIARSRSRMSPFALEHARIGLVDEIAQNVGTRARVTGQINVANSQILNSPEGQRRLVAAFDSPQQAASFLETVNQQNQLMRNAQAWGGGSTSYSNLAHGEDNAMAAIAEVAGETLHGGPHRGLMTAGRQIGNFFSDNAIERANNQAGEVLLRRIDSEDAKSFTEQVIRILRQREQARAASADVARATAAQSGSAAAGRNEQRR